MMNNILRSNELILKKAKEIVRLVSGSRAHHLYRGPFNELSYTMDDIEVLEVTDIDKSKYMHPQRVTYIQDGIKKTWDFSLQHDSVAVLIFNVTTQSFVMVKQFRPAVYMKVLDEMKKKNIAHEIKAVDGVTTELCAGIVDRDDAPIDIAAAEVLEETGYRVQVENMKLINIARNGVGTTGAVQYLYYVQVDDSMKEQAGGGIDNEYIELYNLKLEDLDNFMTDTTFINRPTSLLYAYAWFIINKEKLLK